MPDASVSVPVISGSLPEVSGDVSVPSVGSGAGVDVAVPSVDVGVSAPSASIDLPGEYISSALLQFGFKVTPTSERTLMRRRCSWLLVDCSLAGNVIFYIVPGASSSSNGRPWNCVNCFVRHY